MKISADRPAFWKVTFGATLLVGTLDISDAFIFYGLRGVAPVRILQSIAAGILGRSSFSMGNRSAILGLVCHFFIALCATTVYLFAARNLPLSGHPLAYGTLFGIALYIVMNYLVLPISKIGLRPTPPLITLINGVAALVVCIGLPLAYIARRYVAPQIS